MSKKSILIILVSVLSVMITQISKAAVITVTTTQDKLPGSLRAAITEANRNGQDDIINLPAGRYFLDHGANENRNTSGDLDIFNSQTITIRGENTRTTIIDGYEHDRVLHILDGTVSIYGVTFQGGNSRDSDGGGIYNNGELTLINCVVRNNGTGNDNKAGGGIYNNGSLVLTNCTIYNNTTGDGNFGNWGTDGGDGAGICNNQHLTLTNCTISNNKTGDGGDANWCRGGNGGDGGGIYNNSGCTASITSCTIGGNQTGKGGWLDFNPPGCIHPSDGSPGRGGGIYNIGSVIIKNTIIANNTGDGPDCNGTLNSQGYNLIQKTGQCNIRGIKKGNITGKDPLLRGLDDNGGPTKTQALRQGSPAIDAGNSFGITNDQREFVRPHDIPGIPDVNDGSDIGAYEYESYLPSPYYNLSGKITCYGMGLPGVTLVFSNNGGAAATGADGNYSHPVPYSWSGTVTPAKEGYTFNPSSRNYTAVITNQPNQDFTAISIIPPQISLNRTQLYFGADTSGKQTGPQSFLISNSGGGILNWTAVVYTSGDNWLICNPASGTGSALVTVSINPSGLLPGTHQGTITAANPNAINSPQTVNVTLTMYDAGSTNLPFGSFDTPSDGSVVAGSIPLTGWVIDNIGIENIKIYRDPLAGEGSGLIYIGNAVMVEGARPDIETVYPAYPNNYKAGWGYLMLTNGLPEQGNGTFTLYAKATDKEGNTVTLGSKTITCDNAHAVKPFGSIDTPAQGGTASGGNYVNNGWALTPLPNTIPINGSTITVWVDGIPLGRPVYNESRPDVAALFPTCNNSAGAGGHFLLDTRAYPNGVHTIAWTVAENGGNADGIGSRYFSIQNTGTDLSRRGDATFSAWSPVFDSGSAVSDSWSSIADRYGAVRVKKGFNADMEANEMYPDEEGVTHIEIRELERVEIHLSPGTVNISPLPIGSTLDVGRGIFYWQPGPGFIGDYEFIFLTRERNGETVKTPITVKINPKSQRGGKGHE